MDIASISQLKKELGHLSTTELTAVCLRLAKYKKENKELLNYLLFEQENEANYIQSVRDEIDQIFDDAAAQTIYHAKKSVRKGLRIANKYIKYSAAPGTEIEILIHLCTCIKNCNRSVRNSQQILNLFDRQIVRINKSIAKLHEDLQYDYEMMLEESGIVK